MFLCALQALETITKPLSFCVSQFFFLLGRHGCRGIQRILLHSRLHGESIGHPVSYTDIILTRNYG